MDNKDQQIKDLTELLERSMAQTDKAIALTNRQSEQIDRLLEDLEAATK